MKKRTFWGIIIVVAIIIVLVMLVPFAYQYTWGGTGKLSLTISTGTQNLSLSERGYIEVDYTLTNTGGSKLRVLDPQGWNHVYAVNLNGTSLRYTGPLPSPPARGPDDSDLFILEAGKSRTWQYRLSGHSWEMQKNTTYKMLGSYWSKDVEGTITLPYWKGELTSNAILFNFTG